MIKILSLWYSQVLLRLLKDNEKKLYRNLECRTLKLERNKSHLMFNETCYDDDILPKFTSIIMVFDIVNFQLQFCNHFFQVSSFLVNEKAYNNKHLYQ